MKNIILAIMVIIFITSCPSVKVNEKNSNVSTIAQCGAGIDEGVKAKIDAAYEKQKGNIGADFSAYVHASLDPNTVSDTKYTEYIKCVLEIDKRNRASMDNGDPKLLTPSQYHTKWEKMRNEGFYPTTVDGKCENGAEYYIVNDWKPLPLGASFYSYTAMKKDSYKQLHESLSSKGYYLVYESNFKDCSGIERYQATWFKKS